MSKITTYNKLVRDNIPEIIKANGSKVKYRILEDDEEFKKALKVKLVEEIDEFLNAKTEEEAVEELGGYFYSYIVLKSDDWFVRKGRRYRKGSRKGIFLKSYLSRKC